VSAINKTFALVSLTAMLTFVPTPRFLAWRWGLRRAEPALCVQFLRQAITTRTGHRTTTGVRKLVLHFALLFAESKASLSPHLHSTSLIGCWLLPTSCCWACMHACVQLAALGRPHCRARDKVSNFGLASSPGTILITPTSHTPSREQVKRSLTPGYALSVCFVLPSNIATTTIDET
jgi:hypothetical protein